MALGNIFAGSFTISRNTDEFRTDNIHQDTVATNFNHLTLEFPYAPKPINHFRIQLRLYYNSQVLTFPHLSRIYTLTKQMTGCFGFIIRNGAFQGRRNITFQQVISSWRDIMTNPLISHEI